MPAPLSARAYARITWIALLAVAFIILTGAAVRLTGSGLGCSQWPTCENDRIVAPMELRPMIEFGNRMVTGLVSVAVIGAVLGSLVLEQKRRDLTRWSLGLVAGVFAQAVLGGISVKVGLHPAFISAHFLLSMVLLWNAVVLHHKAAHPDPGPAPVVDEPTVRLGRAAVGLSAIVLFTGTLVTGTGPHAGDERAPRYGFATITDVARVHSIAVWCFLAVALVVLWRLTKAGAPATVDNRARLLVTAILLQGALGYVQYFAGVPPYLVIAHILGAVLVFVATLELHLSLFTPAEPAPQPGPADSPATVPVTPLPTA